MAAATAEIFKAWRRPFSPEKSLASFFKETFPLALKQVDHRSSTGCGFYERFTTIGDALGWNGICYDDKKVTELRNLTYQRMLLMLSGEHVENPLKVFVKPEPHKKAKLVEGRLRLISAVSFEDTMIDRMLFHWLSEAALTNIGSTPSMIGWTPLFGAWRAFRNRLPLHVLCLDKAAWDWTVQPWLIRVLEGVVHHLATDAPEWWTLLVVDRFRALFYRAKFRFLDGSCYDQDFPGIMKSGCFLTILLNTIAQVALHLEACLRAGEDPEATMPFALGDDTVQPARFKNVIRYIEALESLGAKVKPALPQTTVEFAGFTITHSTVQPTYTTKHLFNMEYSPDLQGSLRAYQMLYSRSQEYYTLFSLVAKKWCPQALVLRPQALAFMG